MPIKPTNPALLEFVGEVFAEAKQRPKKDQFTISRANAIAAANCIATMLGGAAKGGKASKGKAGPKIKRTDRKAELTRERVRRHRANKETKV